MRSRSEVALAVIAFALSAAACSDDGSAPKGAGGSGAGGADSGTEGGGAGGALPGLLSETGLYADIAADRVADGVLEFEPRYALWSDGSSKRRWLKLPPGETIDTTDPDFWVFPTGTQVWKEFTRDGARAETRLLEKTADGWEMLAYAWQTDGSDAEAVPQGRQNVAGTQHDIPSTGDCAACHEKSGDVLIGVSAVLLAHRGPGVTLARLEADGRLSRPLPPTLDLPGDEVARSAMGYLHVNCGPCHNSTSELYAKLTMDFWQRVDRLDAVEDTPVWQTAVGKKNPLAQLETIAPGRPDESLVVDRMSRRGVQQMPPLGSERVDDDGVAAVRAWIASIGQADAGVGGSGGAASDAGAD